MTAQIAIMNERCVAVASDSTLTIGHGERRRSVQTADKLFDLGGRHRVVVMVSGSAQFMEVPYDVLIGEWKRTVESPLPGIRDYATSFVTWLARQETLFGETQQRRLLAWLVRDMYLAIRASLIDRLEDGDLTSQPWDSIDVQRSVDAVVGEWIDRLTGRDDLDGTSHRRDADYLAAAKDVVQEAFDYVFDDVPRTVGSDRRLLAEVPPLTISKSEPWSIDGTVAFVGYGEHEVFPGHQIVELTGIVNGRVLMDWWVETHVSQADRAILVPIAQDEAIRTFLSAYNRDFLSLAHRRIDSVLDGVWGHGRDEDDDEQRGLRSAAHDDLRNDFESMSWERFVMPMLDTVEALPTCDMARTAESLVGLQALRAANGDRQPSVGGPIDVAVVTRDGVEWVRRKNGRR